ncbi:MAG TPA: ABC-ATPase domain-containing protein [Longimicrobiales bacterium]|nr:ABC-ATPase domain-containing protein [Longimicrobiales bacterium]
MHTTPPARGSPDLATLRPELESWEGRGYKAYRALQGRVYAGPGFDLVFDHVQGDPFADPTRLRALYPTVAADLPSYATRTPDARRASADFLHRRMAAALSNASASVGSGHGGAFATPRPVQQVLGRSAARVGEDGAVELRFRVGLPARGRRILGAAAGALLCDGLPQAMGSVLPLSGTGRAALRRHVQTVEDAVALRARLEAGGLVAFVADGSILPRRSGVDDAPMERERAVPFRSPDSLRVTLPAPHAGEVAGMGVPRGVTLIVGGGYHGKSTLLRALERGVYDHAPDDGRERVVSIPGATKVRAEDRRAVVGTDISNFIRGLPSGADTLAFSTEDASGSTSQAAAIAEAIETGCACLLIDEDTSATNFMIRDARMRRLVEDADEPVIPFIDRARQLLDGEGTSSVLVVGGSGDFFDVADTVIAMRRYVPADVGEAARRIASEAPEPRPDPPAWRPVAPHAIDGARLARMVGGRLRAPTRDRLVWAGRELNLGGIEQILEAAQTKTIGQGLRRLARDAADARGLLMEAVERLMRDIARGGLDVLQEFPTGDLAEFRPEELVAALHRIRP